MGPYLFFRVLIFAVLASFMQRMSILSASIQQWFRFKLLANFDFHLCLRFDFHTLSFWVLILAALGPYWVLISQKNGSLSQSLGVFLSFRGSGPHFHLTFNNWTHLIGSFNSSPVHSTQLILFEHICDICHHTLSPS